MKTPRDILLARHQTTAPKLDAIRREVVAELNNQGAKVRRPAFSLVTLFLGASKKIWEELFLPSRRTWATLAAVWLLLGAVNFSQRERFPMSMAKSASDSGIMTTFRDQQKLLNELFADSSPAATVDADRPKMYSPKPRTEKNQFRTV